MTKYITVRIPECYQQEMDKLIEKHGYASRAEIVKTALREFFQKYPETKITPEAQNTAIKTSGSNSELLTPNYTAKSIPHS
ncbi:MAG: ribbon-helix-helix domain-containing protein [Nitrososphaerota archaeon]|jgi:Arc/MetJ-type ribon-helix-helix transcriptional regulator|uniref:ribbon-helix-helix domain-containing protein n=1 Tax=Candidatus Bathycorpusculum sp. TaxID=2994959 RepID=UPI002838AFD7|nr:ribbon-helix-helix domain-containing protein [Candidatus Termitimicrobium sp.]MDR0493237.1 ribbon-helix-helix domain-containing protein [Nitrososphaerota archaeon]